MSSEVTYNMINNDAKKNFHNGRIYLIRNFNNDKIFVGSTTQNLVKNFAYHKNNVIEHRYMNRQLYQDMEKYGIETYYIELHEMFPCKSLEELQKREREVIRQFDTFKKGYNTCDKTMEQIKQNREKHHLEYCSEYYKLHKDELLLSKKQKFICPTCGGKFTRVNKQQHLKSIKHNSIDFQMKYLRHIHKNIIKLHNRAIPKI